MHQPEVAAPPGQRRKHRTIIDPVWVKAAREHAGITQDELAKRLDVGPSTVSHREGGRQKVYVEAWLAILNACGLPADWYPGKPLPETKPS